MDEIHHRSYLSQTKINFTYYLIHPIEEWFAQNRLIRITC